MTVTRRSGPSLVAIAAYSDLTGSMASQPMPAALSCSSRCRTVWDLPDPVAPVTRACRLSVASGTRKAPTGRAWTCRVSPSREAPDGTCVAVQDLPEPYRLPVVHLAGDVEVAGLQHADAGHFQPGQAS